MDGYDVRDLITKANSGKRICVISRDHRSSCEAFGELKEAGEFSKVLRASGRERLETNAGGVITFHSANTGIRGLEADVVFLNYLKGNPPGLIESVMPAVLARGGELIHS